MLVSELFQKLSYGEFSNLSLSSEGSGSIAAGKKGKVVDYLNSALTKLYSRFVLAEKMILIEQVAGIEDYRLSSKFAVSNVSAPPGTELYIKDSLSDPFEDDLIKVLAVYDAAGTTLPLNDPDDPASVFTPKPLVLQVVDAIDGAPLQVIYQAKHVLIPDGDDDAEIEIPDVLEMALRAYVAHLGYFHMNGQEHAAKANDYLSIYESECQMVEQFDLVGASPNFSGIRFIKRGFV